jgi:hypothetical protein
MAMHKKKGMAKGGTMKKKKGMAKGGAMMKKKAMKKGGMMKKGMAMGGVAKPDFLDIDKDGNKSESMKKASRDMKGMKKGGMTKKSYAKGGMNKKAYAKGGKVMTYNVGGMVKSQGKVNTGIRMAKGGAMGGMKKR